MLATEGCSQELVIRPNLDKATTFQKAAARITLISVISRQVNTNSSVLRNDSVPITFPEIREHQVPEISMMSSANILPVRRDGHLASVTEGSNESMEDKNGVSKGYNGVNGNAVERADDGNNGDSSARNSVKDSKFSKKVVNGQQEQSNPFDYMKERKLSEPVLSPRKRTSVVAPKLTRCRSTVDLRDNEKPMVLKELGGYKFYAKASEPIETSSNGKAHSRVDENTKTNDVSALNKTITEQKENITNREKHILHLEKKLALLEHENSKNKKQISSFREKLKDCSGTVDYLRREKELLASERDRLSFTLLTSEHELKELRTQNINLVTEYESAEHSRRIAVGHLQEVERVCHESHQEKPDHTAKKKVENSSRNSEKNSGKISEKNSEKLIAQLNSMKEAVRKLRLDREALQNELNKMNSFFAENLKNLVDQVQDIKSERNTVPPDDSRHEVAPSDEVSLNVDAFLEPENPTVDAEDVNELDGFKKKLKSNEHCIDEIANQIRDLEKRKKDLLEKRFEMIQEFQAGRDVLGELEADTSGNDTEEKVESEVEGGDRKRSRVTRKIRKLERTLSMDHGVGKLDCIQKLCKNLEDCEQRIHELEATNSELRAEHEDMEEEAKYLKYVLSYRGDVMKAQLQSEYENKMAALKDELEKCKRSETSRSEVVALTKRNRSLEEEVQRLHEELNTLLQNLPALQAVQRSSSRSSEHENSTVDISANFADISSNLENSKNGKDISWNTDSFSKNINQGRPSAVAESGLSENSAVDSRNDDDNSQNLSSEAVRGLEEKVAQLSEEKRVLLLSMQTLTSQWASRENCSENDISFTQNVTVLERNLRDVEQENACLSETLQRIRDVLEEDCERENNNDQEDKILKLKVEIQRFDGKVEARSLTSNENQTNSSCARHEQRISELEMEIYRLHEEKKSLLSSIVRLQTDPNFTLSDDANVSDVINNSDVTDSNVTNDDVISGDVIDVVQSLPTKDAAVSAGFSSEGASMGNDGFKRTHSPLVKKTSRDEEIQVNMSREDIKGLLGYLQRDLDKLRTALDEEGIPGNEPEEEDAIVHDLNTCPRQNSVKEVEQLGKELSDLGHHTHVLEEKLQESEAIRCDLHRTISIATDMATEERQKCEELTRTKAALEKEMLKLAKENRDLREGLETLSRARKRRNPRASRASPSSDTHEDDECREMYLPRAKARNFSESEFSDMDSPVTESKSFSRTA